MKKLLYTFLSCILCSNSIGYVFALDVDAFLTEKPYDGIFDGWGDIEANTDLGKIAWESVTWDVSIVNQLLEWLWFRFDGEQKILQFVANFINSLLAIAGLVALAMLIYAFYRIFRSDGAEATTEAWKYLRNIILALIIIGLSWFITQRAFDLYFSVAESV